MQFAYCPVCNRNVLVKPRINKVLVYALLITSVVLLFISVFDNAIRGQIWAMYALVFAVLLVAYIVYRAFAIEPGCEECGTNLSLMYPPRF